MTRHRSSSTGIDHRHHLSPLLLSPLLLAALSLAACTEAPPADLGAASTPLLCGAVSNGPPFLTDEPACTLEGGGALGGCIGTAVAVGDVNGDGRPDLIVGVTECDFLSPGMGRIAIFPGARTFFSAVPIITDLAWQNTSPSTSARGLSITVGEVNGDGLADLLVRSRYGVQVFAGQADLAAAIAAPVFRAPGNGVFTRSELADVNGDGLDDLVSAKAGTTSVFLSTPGAVKPFTLSRTVPGFAVYARGDFNQDTNDDVLVLVDEGTALYPGCAASTPGCDGGLGAEPLWTVPNLVLGFVPDQNGDSLREVILGEPDGAAGLGRLFLHLSDAQTGGVSPTPIWSALGDPLFVYFGLDVLFPGDLNNDGRSTEMVVTAVGRLYGFFPPPQGVSAALDASWAWPRSDRLTDLFKGQVSLGARAAGDLDHDNYDDLVVGSQAKYDDPKAKGKIFMFRGGKVPPPSNGAPPPPYLPEPATCGVGSGGLPDLTIDGDVLARSLSVEGKAFAADTCEMVEGCVDGPGLRRLLRFSVSIANLGAGPLIIPGPEVAPELYYFDTCHLHHHLTGFASYELRDASGALIAKGRKQGFYLMDSAPYCIDSPPGADYYPDQGITPGWSDVYTNDLPCQWLDITKVPDGIYKLRVSANDDGLIVEQDVLPNYAEVDIEIAGDSVTVLP